MLQGILKRLVQTTNVHFKFCYAMNAKMNTVAQTYQIQPQLMEKIVNDELKTLVAIFVKHQYQIRIAGGAVRDLLSGEKIPDDVDLATTATPTQMKKMFAEENIRTFNEQGEKHGTVTARINDKENFEVTTLRIDKVTDGRYAEVEFTKDWMIDAQRRDLTINSLFLDLDGTVYDFFGGKEDLDSQRIVFVGSADARIKEDYLRILRYFRFYGRIAIDVANHEEETLKAIEKNKEGLCQISGERIWHEWKKILSGPMAGPLTLKMIELGLGPYIGLPENLFVENFENCWQVKKNTLHHITLLVSLFKNQEDMMKLHLRLKLSAYERDLGLFLLEHRDVPITLKGLQKIVILKSWQVGHKTKKDYFKKSNIKAKQEYIEQLIKSNLDANKNLLEEFQSWNVPKCPINGRDLDETNLIPRGKSSGKLLSICLDKLTETWIDSDFKMDKEQLLKIELPKITNNINKCPVNESNLQETNLIPRRKLIGVCLNKLTEIWIDSDFKMDKDQLLKVELPKIVLNLGTKTKM